MAFTPAILQYLDIKKQHADCILFFRMGDFYETFFEDAKICSKVLDIVLTSKNKNSENVVPMAGIPYHSVEKYITKLIHHGYKIAIAEQTSDPIPGKIVSREVVSIITPGTYIQEFKAEYTYTMGITFSPRKDGISYHLARGDFSIGTYRTKSFSDIADLQKFITTIKPVELIFDIDFPAKDEVSTPLQQYLTCLISIRDLPPDPEKFLLSMTHAQHIGSYGKSLEDGRLSAMALLVHYLKHTQKHALTNITKISFHSQDNYLILDEVTIKNLELLTSSYEGSEKYSLVHILDTTQTSGGSRLLRHLLTNPIKDIKQLERRLNHIDHYLQDELLNAEHGTKYLHALLARVLDIPKLVSLILYKKLVPLNIIKLRATLRICFDNTCLLNELKRLGLSTETQGQLESLYNHLQQILKNDEEYGEDMDFVREGYHEEIDKLRTIAYHSDELLLNYQQELAEISGVNNVKVKFVINQGYFLEITNKDIQQFEERVSRHASLFTDAEHQDKFTILRRNTLKGGQRYTTPYLENLQTHILEAKEQLRNLEYRLLHQTKEKIRITTSALNDFAERISWLDLFLSQALLAKAKHYVKPTFTKDGIHSILQGRHPVIEEYLPRDQQFIPNNLEMNDQGPMTNNQGRSEEGGFLHVITGPNMGGKSTYLRQNALIILMAYCGLFVPAKACELGPVDAIFARIGSGDNIAKNQSTFMTEMIEVANILNNATKQSFIIFDELGRGTATYDGLALTKAILEYLATQIKAKTLIATHYHELIQLENTLPGVKNFSVSVYETDKEVIFMKKMVSGGASKSYGIDVAKIAGIPAPILIRAQENLAHLETNNGTDIGTTPPPSFDFNMPKQQQDYQKIKSLLESYDLNNITPLQALQLLDKIKDELKN